jgi:hypothetical protein
MFTSKEILSILMQKQTIDISVIDQRKTSVISTGGKMVRPL